MIHLNALVSRHSPGSALERDSYSRGQKGNVIAFGDWYLAAMGAAVSR